MPPHGCGGMYNPGHDLGAMRRRINHVCPICGRTFVAIRKARFCSNRCRQAEKYRKTKAARQKKE